jgi:hypothetical protein
MKTIHVLNRAATVIGHKKIGLEENKLKTKFFKNVTQFKYIGTTATNRILMCAECVIIRRSMD